MHHVGEQDRHLFVLRCGVSCVTGAPHSLQNLEFAGSSVPHDPHNNPVAVSPPPPSPLGFTSVSFHSLDDVCHIALHLRREILRISNVVFFQTGPAGISRTLVCGT